MEKSTMDGQSTSKPSARSAALIREQWPVFTESVLARLSAGAVEYGDRSLDKQPSALVDEILQELEDVMGWTFLLWCRVQGLGSAKRLAQKSPDCDLKHDGPCNHDLTRSPSPGLGPSGEAKTSG